MGLGFGRLGLGWTTRRAGPGISLLCVRSRLVVGSLDIVGGVCYDDDGKLCDAQVSLPGPGGKLLT